MPDGDSIFGIIANVARDEALRHGAKVWVVDRNAGNAADRVFVRGLDIAGDTIRKWIASADLANARPAWVPDHLRSTVQCYDTRSEAEQIAGLIADYARQENDPDPSH